MAQDAFDALRLVFAQYGMPDLANWVATQVTSGKTVEQVQIEMYDRPEYQKYFPAMDALRKQGQAISEQEYRAVEQGYRDVLSYAGLAGSAYDTPQTFQRLMESQVSARELETRVSDARMVADSTDPNVKRALMDYYGITSDDLMIFALDPKGQGKDHVERLARSATLQGIARSTALSLSQQYSESLAMDPVLDNRTEADYRELLSGVSALSVNQKRLAGIEQSSFTDEDAADIVVKSNAQKTLESKRRADREAARFAGSTGLSSGSLKTGSL